MYRPNSPTAIVTNGEGAHLQQYVRGNFYGTDQLKRDLCTDSDHGPFFVEFTLPALIFTVDLSPNNNYDER